MLLLPIALVLLTAVPEEVRGTSGSLPELAVSMRTNPRLRAGVAGAGLFGISSYSPTFGLGLALDLGVVLADRVSLFVHAEAGTILLTLMGSVGLVGEYALGEHVSAGLGAAFSAWGPLLVYASAPFVGLTFPLRLSISPTARGPAELHRSGLLIVVQVAPGVSLQQNYYPQLGRPLGPQPGLAATLSLGYAWR